MAKASSTIVTQMSGCMGVKSGILKACDIVEVVLVLVLVLLELLELLELAIVGSEGEGNDQGSPNVAYERRSQQFGG